MAGGDLHFALFLSTSFGVATRWLHSADIDEEKVAPIPSTRALSWAARLMHQRRCVPRGVGCGCFVGYDLQVWNGMEALTLLVPWVGAADGYHKIVRGTRSHCAGRQRNEIKKDEDSCRGE